MAQWFGPGLSKLGFAPSRPIESSGQSSVQFQSTTTLQGQ